MWATAGTDLDAVAHDGALIGVLATVLLTLVGILVLLVRNARDSRAAAYHSQQTNYAVNNRGPGEHGLYDLATAVREDVQYLVARQHEFEQKGWNHLPADIGDAPSLTETIRSLQHADREVLKRVDTLTNLLREHDAWERQQKWPGYEPPHDTHHDDQ